MRPHHFAHVAALAVVAVGLGCNGGRARDVAGERRLRSGKPDAAAAPAASVPEVPREPAQPAVTGKRARVVARASARGLAIDATSLYYGDIENDGIYVMPKKGGEAVRLARHAPVAGAIAVDSESITWIASPGDSVLRLPLQGGGQQPTTLRDRGIFSGVTTVSGETFITEVIGAGGALLRVSGPTAARLAAFDGSPRSVVADGTHAYVVTPTKIFRTPHARGEVETLATGTGFANPHVDVGFIYLVAEVGGARVIARVPKTGGPMTTIAHDVRDLPIEIEGGELFFFDAARPQVRAVASSGGPLRVVMEDEMLATANSIVADATTVFVAAGARESGVILAVDRR